MYTDRDPFIVSHSLDIEVVNSKIIYIYIILFEKNKNSMKRLTDEWGPFYVFLACLFKFPNIRNKLHTMTNEEN